MARVLGLWTPVIGFMAAVWFLSDDVSSDLPELFSDKLLHALAFGLFGLANLRAFHGGFRRPKLWASVAALLLTTVFGALDEWRQAGVVLRDSSWGDWIADTVGGLLSWVGYWAYTSRRIGGEASRKTRNP